MGLPLSAPQAVCTSLSKSQEEAQERPPTACSRVLKQTVATRHGVYGFNVAITEQQSRSPAGSSEAGHGTAGGLGETDKPTVLLLHGFMGCAADWNHVTASLALTCRCISVDLPGHGAAEVNAEGALKV